MKYSEENVRKLGERFKRLTGEDRDLSFLVVLEPLTTYIYQQKGKDGESKLITHWKNGKIANKLPDALRTKISNSKDFLDEFVYLEFFLNQLLKLILIDSFQVSQWEKLETIVGGKYLRLEDKKELIKKYSPKAWEKIKVCLKPLQNLRNSLAHSPIGPIFYNGKLVNWELVDGDIGTTRDHILREYTKIQAPLLAMIDQI